MRSSDLIGLLALGGWQASALSLLEVLRNHGFTDYADLLEGNPILNAGPGLIVYAPGNSILSAAANSLRARGLEINNATNSFSTVRNTAPTFVDPAAYPDNEDAGTADAPSGALRETLLSDPGFVNLGPGHNQSLIERNVSSSWPTLFGGLGKTVAVVGGDIHFDDGVVRPIDGILTLPSTMSSTLPPVGAEAFAATLQKVGLATQLDYMPGITVLAPNDAAWNAVSDLPDDQLAQLCREHIIVDFPGYTPLLRNGSTYGTLGKTNVTISVQGEQVSIGGARIVKSDAIIINGVVHTVDKVSLLHAFPLTLFPKRLAD
ncbi:hypothetical protein MFIFM68171_07200 [Madurella fahalii]|uniref:FAS1 domain-containing protein n=1 Tax=Madurella fahalii TaxID=1157608 RepID=A0ABQ0GH26_9PEZI